MNRYNFAQHWTLSKLVPKSQEYKQKQESVSVSRDRFQHQIWRGEFLGFCNINWNVKTNEKNSYLCGVCAALRSTFQQFCVRHEKGAYSKPLCSAIPLHCKFSLLKSCEILTSFRMEMIFKTALDFFSLFPFVFFSWVLFLSHEMKENLAFSTYYNLRIFSQLLWLRKLNTKN